MPSNMGIVASQNNNVVPPEVIVWATDDNYTGASATSTFNPTFNVFPSWALNTTKLLTGSPDGKAWSTNNTTNQRFCVNRPTPWFFNRIRLVNWHNAGSETNNGIKNIKIYCFNQTSNTTYGALTKQRTKIYDGPIPTNPGGDGANYYILPLLVDRVYNRNLPIDIVDNYGGAVMGFRRIEFGTRDTFTPTKINFDCSAASTVLDNSGNPVPLNNRAYEMRSTTNSGAHSIDLTGCAANYGMYGGKPGVQQTAAFYAGSDFQGIFNTNNVWQINVISFTSNPLNDSIYGVGPSTVQMNSGSDRADCFFSYNSSNNNIILLNVLSTSSSGGLVITRDNVIAKPANGTLIVLAGKMYNKTGGGVASSHITPGTNTIKENIIHPSASFSTDPNYWQYIQAYIFSNQQVNGCVLHEFSYNEATDSTIIDKVNALRTKWNAI